MFKQRILPVLLMMVALSLFLVACGGSNPEPETVPVSQETAPQETPVVQTPVAETSDTLVGAWRWADDATWLYTFNADGTGTRGFEWQGLVPFTWRADSSSLNIATLPMQEEWAFAIVEEEGLFFLAIESLQVPGMSFVYMFTDYVEDVAPEDYSMLLGAWAWVDELGNIYPWDYVFFSDGSGVRGTTEAFDVFWWEADFEIGYLSIYIPEIVEEWDLELTADTFTASSADLPGVRLIYNRIR